VIEAPSNAIMPLLPYQKRDVESNARFKWSCWSRQTGKSFSKALRRLVRGLARRKTQIFLSAGERQSRELMDKARMHCQALKVAADFRDDAFFEGTSFKLLQITLPNNVRIIGLPANPRTARGFTGDVFLDEFALHQGDRDIWAAMFPTVLRGGGEIDVASTPKGKKNVFYQLAGNPAFEHDTVTLQDAIDQGLDVDAEEMRRGIGDEELYRQEFGCEFIDEATAFLTYELIGACEDPQLPRAIDWDALEDEGQTPGRGRSVFVGVDLGRKKDLTVIWPFAAEGARLVSLGLIELRNTRFREQYERLSQVLRSRCVRRCCIDATGLGMQLAESAVEDFGGHRVEAVTFTNTVKAALAEPMRIKVQDRNIRIPMADDVRNDWHSIQRTITAAGNVRYDGDRSSDGHADRFWAAALAVHAAGDAAGPIECMGGKRLASAGARAW